MLKSLFHNFFQSELKIRLLLLFISILAYWEISLLQYSVKWDMLDVILPWRFYVGECLRNNYFPLWNPYQSAGYPIHADLQCPTWYPETILIGSTIGYSNITLHILFTLYIFISGLGIFKLTKHFGTDNLPAFISGAAFMLTGIFVSHAQHMFIIVSLAWIPWTILYYMKISEGNFKYINILILSLFTFLLISGGYQSLSIVMGYLFLTLFIFYCIRVLIKRDYRSLLVIITSNLVWVLITTGLCLVIISSLRDIFEYVERMSGISLAQAQVIPFTPRSLISLLVPFGVVKDPGFFNTDISMTNLYVGIFMLGFFIAGLFIRLKPELKILLIFGFIFLLASFGNYLPVREWLYKYFPLMSLFRIPGFLRIIIVIPVIISGGLAINALLKGAGKMQKWIIIPFAVIGCFLILILIWSAVRISAGEPLLTSDDISISERFSSASVFTHILIHSIIQLLFLVVFFLLYYKKIRLKIIIPVFVLMEMFLAVQMNIKYTGCSPYYNPMVIRKELKERPQGFPLPPPFEISINTDVAAEFKPLCRNVNIFNKTVSFDAFTSLKLKGYKYLEDESTILKEAILKNRLTYLSDRIFNEDEYDSDTLKTFHPIDLFFSGEDFIKLNTVNIKKSPGDTVFLTSFSPNEIKTFVKTKQPQILTLLQSNYKGWKVLIDGEPVPHYTSNRLFISTQIPPGEHEIIFHYSNNIVKAAFIFSYSLFMVILFILLWNYVKKKYPKPIKIIIPVFISFVILLVFILFLNYSRRNRPGKIYHKYVETAIDFSKSHKLNTKYIFIVDDPSHLEKIMKESGNPVNYTVYNHISPLICSQLWNDMTGNQTNNLLFARINVRSMPEITYILKELYPKINEVSSTRISTLMQLSNESTEPRKYLFSNFNDFETINEDWRGNSMYIDSSNSFSGNFSNRIDSLNKLSYILEIPCSLIDGKGTFIINISASVFLPNEISADVVLHIKRNDKTVGYYTLNLNEAVTERNTWRKVFLSKYLRYNIRCNDKISIYMRNNSNGTLWVDDFKVTLLKKES